MHFKTAKNVNIYFNFTYFLKNHFNKIFVKKLTWIEQWIAYK